MTYCETYEEQKCFDMLRQKFPNSPEFMLDLMAWTFINKPDRFEAIMEEHRNSMDKDMIELQDFDYKSIMRQNPIE